MEKEECNDITAGEMLISKKNKQRETSPKPNNCDQVVNYTPVFVLSGEHHAAQLRDQPPEGGNGGGGEKLEAVGRSDRADGGFVMIGWSMRTRCQLRLKWSRRLVMRTAGGFPCFGSQTKR